MSHVSTQSQGADASSLALLRAQHAQFACALNQGVSLVTALRHCGIMFWRHGRLDDAAQMLTAASEAVPDDPAIVAELGYILRAQGKKAEAMQCMLRSLALDSRQLQVWLSAAGLSNEAGDKSAAEDAYMQALALDGRCAEAAVGLGLLYVEAREYKKGARLLGLAVDLGAASAPIWACLAQTRYLLGDFSGASVAFAQALRFGPADCALIQRYGRVRLIETVIERPVEEAIAIYLETTGERAEDVLDVCRAAFQALGGYGPHEAAIRLGRALLERMPDDPVIGFHLAALTGHACDRAPSSYLTASFNKYAQHFDKHLVEVLDYQVPAKIHSLLAETGGTFKHLLDLGCGTGLSAPYFASFGGRLTGVDLSPGMLDKARERGLYERLVEDEVVAFLSRCEETYDLIAALDVLVYFGDLAPLFAAVASRLEPGGIFAFSYETGDCEDTTLQPSGRFAHAVHYIEALYGKNFVSVTSKATMLRLETNRPVDGQLVLLRRV
ncbi:MAG TPA: methyltransferase domain-containing protein [Methylocella sp.]|jgi:predicted TPR repeat methyltransferase